MIIEFYEQMVSCVWFLKIYGFFSRQEL
jgi:hypothetical protein